MKKLTILMPLLATYLNGSNPSGRPPLAPFNPEPSIWNSAALVAGQNPNATSFNPLVVARPDAAISRPSTDTASIAGTRSLVDPTVVLYQTDLGVAMVRENLFILQAPPRPSRNDNQALCRVAPRIYNEALFEELAKILPSVVYPSFAEREAQQRIIRESGRPNFPTVESVIALERSFEGRYF
ncbi:MAG: hypothetical protein NTU89_02475 [Candidatus Dependentiae bacterium]|nr:hypothetical protein [Candidatus Dependentiae bacterium]